MKKYLNAVYRELVRVGSPALTFLQPGKARVDIEHQAQRLKCTFPAELYSLFQWRNGTKEVAAAFGCKEIFPGKILLSLEKAAEVFKKKCLTDVYWPASHFPVFVFGKDYFLIDINSGSSTHGRIFYYCLASDTFEVLISYFDSLSACFAANLECFRKGIYVLDLDTKCLEIADTNEYHFIMKKYNPRSDFWKN